jgi:uncharacterized protein (DUF433 family)
VASASDLLPNVTQTEAKKPVFERGDMHLPRITVNPSQMGGVPCIRGLRIPVATIVGMVAEGMSRDEILGAFPDLVEEDIREALALAAEALREQEFPLVTVP